MRFCPSKWNKNRVPANHSIPYVVMAWILLIALCVGCKQKDQKNAPSLFDSSGNATRVVPPATGAAVGNYASPNANTPNANTTTQNRTNTTFYGMSSGAAPNNLSYPNHSNAPTTNIPPSTNVPSGNYPSGTNYLPSPPNTSTGAGNAGTAPSTTQSSGAFTASNPPSNAAPQLAWRSPTQTNSSNPMVRSTVNPATNTNSPTQLAMSTSPTQNATTPLLTPVQIPSPPFEAGEHTAVTVAANAPLSKQQVLPVVYYPNAPNTIHPTQATATTAIPTTGNIQPSNAQPTTNAPIATNAGSTSSLIWNTIEDGNVPTPVIQNTSQNTPQNARPRPIDAASIR